MPSVVSRGLLEELFMILLVTIIWTAGRAAASSSAPWEDVIILIHVFVSVVVQAVLNGFRIHSQPREVHMGQ